MVYLESHKALAWILYWRYWESYRGSKQIAVCKLGWRIVYTQTDSLKKREGYKHGGTQILFLKNGSE